MIPIFALWCLCVSCLSAQILTSIWVQKNCLHSFQTDFFDKMWCNVHSDECARYLPMPLKPMHVLTSELCDKHVQQHGAKHFNFAVHLFLHSAPSTQAVQTLMMCVSCCRHYVLKQLQQWQCSSSSCKWPAASLWRRFHCGGAHEERKKKKKKKTEKKRKGQKERKKHSLIFRYPTRQIRLLQWSSGNTPNQHSSGHHLPHFQWMGT